MTTDTPQESPAGPVARPRPDGRAHRTAIAAIALAVVFVGLAAQNSGSVNIHLLLWHLRTPLYGLAVFSALFGAIVVEASAGLWRHRRQIHDREHRELLRLRSHRRPKNTGVKPAG